MSNQPFTSDSGGCIFFFWFFLSFYLFPQKKKRTRRLAGVQRVPASQSKTVGTFFFALFLGEEKAGADQKKFLSS
jgi:hypothetical protein